MKSNNKNKIVLMLTIFTASLFSGCQEYLDVNTNPNRPTVTELRYTMPAATAELTRHIGGRWQMMGGIWAQHWTSEPNAPNYQLVDNYGLEAGGTYTEWTWSGIYTGVLPDLQYVRERAELEEKWNHYLIASVLEAYTYQNLVDLYDKVPFSLALQKEAAPFDNGEVVYDGIIAKIDEALEKYNNSTTEDIVVNDLIFEGVMKDWVAFANTLKLKIYLRQIYKRGNVANDGIALLIAENAEFLDKDASFKDYSATVGKENPAYGLEWRGGSNNIVASKTLLNYLLDAGSYEDFEILKDQNGNDSVVQVTRYYDDPRLDAIYSVPTTGVHLGMIQGDYRNADLQSAKFSKAVVMPDQPVYLISHSESLFLQAEAALRGHVKAKPAKQLYEDAVQVNLNNLGVSMHIDSIVAEGKYGEYVESASMEEKLETIIMQKWVSFANTQGLEAFLEFNRTGYPKKADLQPSDEGFNPNTYKGGEFLISVTGTLPDPHFPKRLLFPGNETSKNPYVPATQPMHTRVWWDVKDN